MPAKRWRRYTPLQSHSALFRIFADVESTTTAIVSFADNYGLLTDPVKGEPIPMWQAAIAEMRSAVEGWETGRSSDAELISGSMSTGTSVEPFSDVDLAPSRGADPDHQGRSGPFESAVPERRRATERLPRAEGKNEELISGGMGRPEPVESVVYLDAYYFLGAGASLTHTKWDTLAFKLNEHISRVRPVFNYDRLLDGLSLRFLPPNLLVAMWLQFGQAVEANKSFRKCRQCGLWFELTPRAARADKVFCSGACKARDYRRRLALRSQTQQGSGAPLACENAKQ